MSQKFGEVVSAFVGDKNFEDMGSYGEGHINDTCLANVKLSDGKNIKLIFQKINHNIFTNTDGLMNNILGVTEFLKDIIVKNGGDPDRETLTVVKTLDGKLLYKDSEGNYWRAYTFIDDTNCFQSIECDKDFYNCGVAFGNFQRQLANYPVDKLCETIVNFHNTESRIADLEKAIAADVKGRAKNVAKEIEFALSRKESACEIVNLIRDGKMPMRVTHNDTKLNNILFDKQTGKALCIIDLDTVMPGAAAYDFGDSIRFGASTGAEDEVDLDKIEMDLHLYEVFAEGYLSVAKEFLTVTELYSLSIGAKIMTYECGIRFLTDYLNGDTYFKIHRENHNLDRCRTQFKLVADMEQKMDQMHEIIKQHSKQ